MKIVEHQNCTEIVIEDYHGSGRQEKFSFSTEAGKAYLNAVKNGDGLTFDVTGVFPVDKDTNYEYGDSYEETIEPIDEMMTAAVFLGHLHVIKQIVEKYPNLLKAAEPLHPQSKIFDAVMSEKDLSTLKILMEKVPCQDRIDEMANDAISISAEEMAVLQKNAPELFKFLEAAQALAKVYATKPSASKSQQSFFTAKDEEVSTEASVGLAHSL